VIAVERHGALRVLVVVDEVEDRVDDQSDRLLVVDRARREHALPQVERLEQVTGDRVVAVRVRGVGQQHARMREGDRLVVDVDDAGVQLGPHLVGDLVHVALRRQP
jgi:hypothetical protein